MPKITIDDVEPVVSGVISVEKNIPIPPSRQRRTKYPWSRMEIGDSFLFPKERNLAACRTAAWYAGKKLGCKFSVIETSAGCRCWKVEDNG